MKNIKLNWSRLNIKTRTHQQQQQHKIIATRWVLPVALWLIFEDTNWWHEGQVSCVGFGPKAGTSIEMEKNLVISLYFVNSKSSSNTFLSILNRNWKFQSTNAKFQLMQRDNHWYVSFCLFRMLMTITFPRSSFLFKLTWNWHIWYVRHRWGWSVYSKSSFRI